MADTNIEFYKTLNMKQEIKNDDCKIAVVIPCYKVSAHLKKVISGIGPEVFRIYCVEDGCPEKSAQEIKKQLPEEDRLRVISYNINRGVGGAVMEGYKAAVEDNADVIIKLDGDGQMDPAYIAELVSYIIKGEADYVKGNRFYHLESLKQMPLTRLIGNAGLSFLTKMSTGYWNLFDPTNGYTAIHSAVARELLNKKIHPRYFFESDMLFHLGLMRAVIIEVPMDAIYADEKSNLNQWQAFVQFPVLHLRKFVSRLFYNYFLRNFSAASLNFILGLILFVFGIVFGLVKWITNMKAGIITPTGTVMIAALSIILGVQLLMSFLAYDMADKPQSIIHTRLKTIFEMRTAKKSNHD
jgi:glycosyltransferase involved in cell wall biosynthesis